MNNMNRYGADESVLAKAAQSPSLFLCRVISQYNDQYKIATECGECLAEVSGKFRYEAANPSQFPAVGDFALADRTEDSAGNAILHRVLPRKSVFERTATDNEHQSQIIATNIDIVFICMSLNNNYNLSRLERYLSAAWSSGATPVVVLTKSDLCENLSAVLSEIMVTAPGTDVIATSRNDPNSFEKLLPHLLPNRTAAFIGSSGVGKSTLINCLAGENLLATSQIRQDDKGRHTTTRREMILLPKGGIVIDTPGLRELGVESVDLSRSFAEIDALAEHCRFRDCTHTNEPGCAVLMALETGELTHRRLESYQKLKREAGYDGLSFRQIETQKLNAMSETIGGMKNMRKFIRQSDKRKGGF